MIVFGDGAQTRDFAYVSDTARGILMAGTSEAAVGRTINLGSGSEVAISDLARQVARAAHRSSWRLGASGPASGRTPGLRRSTTGLCGTPSA